MVDLQRHISAFISSPSPCVFKRQHHKITFNLKVLHQRDVTRATTTYFLQQRLVILHLHISPQIIKTTQITHYTHYTLHTTQYTFHMNYLSTTHNTHFTHYTVHITHYTLCATFLAITHSTYITHYTLHTTHITHYTLHMCQPAQNSNLIYE